MVLVVLVMSVMVMVAGAVNTIPSRKFTKQDMTQVEGGIQLVSKKVQTSIECSAICTTMDCLDYTLTTSSHCTTYSSVTQTIGDAEMRLYSAYRQLGEACRDDSLCAGISHAACVGGNCNCVLPAFPDNGGSCTIFNLGVSCSSNEQCQGTVNNTVCSEGTCQCIYGLTPDFNNNTCLYTAAAKGEACAVDTQCTLTQYNVCLNVTEGMCVCTPGAIDEGDSCRALSLGEACTSTIECVVGMNNSTCVGVCQCAEKFLPADNNTRCQYDYASGGFTAVGGRWALFMTFVPMSWDALWIFCWAIQAKMFTPKNAAEFELMKTEGSEHDLLGNFYIPINDKNGQLLWDNGSSATGVSFLPWQGGVEGTKNFLSFFPNCGFVAKISPFLMAPYWEVKLTGCLDLSSSMVSCEATMN
ncbi:hypothetical protein O3P69_020687 [Scylla paramamosain]|uniref:Uncharacterized protein n=1 Tax=Scylla paramamosain TaxID=85552 RepID=A0AAW0TNH2_SCYPA